MKVRCRIFGCRAVMALLGAYEHQRGEWLISGADYGLVCKRCRRPLTLVARGGSPA